jgi:anti-sigma factor RsiW
MVSNGNHPLIEAHCDKNLLHDYVLGHLPPDEAERVRQHLMICPSCRATADDIRAFCQQLKRALHEELDSVQPGPQLNFDRILAQQRAYRRRRLFWLHRLAPGTPLVALVVVVVVAVVALRGVWRPDAAPIQPPASTDQYAGPPAVVAATTANGLVVVRLSAGQDRVVTTLDDVVSPHRLQFSPDGRWLAYRQTGALFVRDAGQERAFQFPVQDSAEWAWSPDSQTLAYTDGNGQLIIFNPATNASRVLVPAEDAAWGAPVWDDDGGHISYTVLKPLNARAASYQRQGIWNVAVDTGYRAELVRNPVPYDTLLIANARPNPLGPRSLSPNPRLSQEVLSQRVLPSQPLASSPDGAWMLYNISGPVQRPGLYLFSLRTGEQRLVDLPDGGTDIAAFWGDSGHLFVIRQAANHTTAELWIVPLAADETPQCVLSDIQLPADSDWRDRLSAQLLTP